jgi:hypothetical protein
MRPLLALGLACVALNAQTYTRRPLSTPARSGWALLSLDADAQRQSKGLWISDDQGRPVPFQEMHRGANAAQETPAPQQRLGRNDKGWPTAAFELPEGGPRTLRLQVDPVDRPWVARALLERQGPGGTWVLWDPRPRPHAWQLHREEGLSFELPAESGPWRLSLKPVVGRPPRLLGLTLTAPAEAWSLQEEAQLPVAFSAVGNGAWRLTLPEGESILSFDVHLKAPAAPLAAELLVPLAERPQDLKAAQPLGHEGALWALPALESEASRLTLYGATGASTLFLRLPEGGEPDRIEARVHRATLRVPVEQGRSYWAHFGGTPKVAPGELGALPMAFDPKHTERLTLGAAVPDPEGHTASQPHDGLGRMLPWAVGAAVLALAAVAWRLLQSGAPD